MPRSFYLAILNLISLTFGDGSRPSHAFTNKIAASARTHIYTHTHGRSVVRVRAHLCVALAGFPQGSTSAPGLIRAERLPREGCRAEHLIPGPAATNRGNTTSRESLTSCASHRIYAPGPAPAPADPVYVGLSLSQPSRETICHFVLRFSPRRRSLSKIFITNLIV